MTIKKNLMLYVQWKQAEKYINKITKNIQQSIVNHNLLFWKADYPIQVKKAELLFVYTFYIF